MNLDQINNGNLDIIFGFGENCEQIHKSFRVIQTQICQINQYHIRYVWGKREVYNLLFWNWLKTTITFFYNEKGNHLYIVEKSEEPKNRVFKHYVSIKSLSFPSLHRTLEAYWILSGGSQRCILTKKMKYFNPRVGAEFMLVDQSRQPL